LNFFSAGFWINVPLAN